MERIKNRRLEMQKKTIENDDDNDDDTGEEPRTTITIDRLGDGYVWTYNIQDRNTNDTTLQMDASLKHAQSIKNNLVR